MTASEIRGAAATAAPSSVIRVSAGQAGFWRNLFRGPYQDPSWQRPALFGLVAFTTLLYTWGLDRNGWANSYYSAAAMAGSQDWTAFFFGSSDPGNAITVDKPPLGLWIMSLSVRLFGLNSWSILLPQAAMGVLSVYLLYRMVQKRTDAATGLLAGLFLAVLPVATVIFRYNNPDALLTLLMIGAAYATLESIDSGKLWWLLAAGALTGAGFLAKQLQILLVLPAMALSYFIFTRGSVPRKLIHLLAALSAACISGGWWFVVVQLTAPANRPFIGGTRNNNVLELTLGYNGLDRLTGEDASTAMSPTGTGLVEKMDAGYQRFLQPQFTGQMGWFLPLAMAGLCLGIWCIVRRRGSPANRALMLMASAWLVCAATVLAFMSGIMHPYYAVTLAPPLCCLAAIALIHLLRKLKSGRVRLVAGFTMLASMLVAEVAAIRSTVDFPGLPAVMLVVWGISVAALLLPEVNPSATRVTSTVLFGALLLGPILWSINTVLSPHVGAGVTAGPSVLNIRTDHPSRQQLPPNTLPSFTALMFGDIPATGTLTKLRQVPDSATWVSAIVSSESAANYQLETGRAILAIGGFSGTDQFPTLEQFQELVGDGKVGSMVIQNLPPVTLEGRGESARIVSWVTSHYSAESIDGAQYYDLQP